jgi:hypothetical protein
MYGSTFYLLCLAYAEDVIPSRFNLIINYMNLSAKMKKLCSTSGKAYLFGKYKIIETRQMKADERWEESTNKITARCRKSQ